MQHALLLKRNKIRGLSKFAFAFLVSCLALMTAQAQITVSGKITSGGDQSELPGVNVLVKGKTVFNRTHKSIYELTY